MTVHRAAFLDKDGTIAVDVPFNVDPQRIRLLPGTPEGLRRLERHGYRLVVISNQAGVALGRFLEQDLAAAAARVRELFEDEGVKLSGFYYCPHHPDGHVARYAIACACRKPQPGLLFRAASDLEIDLHESWMIGDILDDIEAGKRAGCRTVLIDNGGETEWRMSATRIPDLVLPDLESASLAITANGAAGTARFSDRGLATT